MPGEGRVTSQRFPPPKRLWRSGKYSPGAEGGGIALGTGIALVLQVLWTEPKLTAFFSKECWGGICIGMPGDCAAAKSDAGAL